MLKVDLKNICEEDIKELLKSCEEQIRLIKFNEYCSLF